MILLPVVSGIHLEGPFISEEKKGAHPPKFLRTFKAGGVADLMETYGHLDNVAMVTLAPELANSAAAIRELSGRGIAVSLGACVISYFFLFLINFSTG